MRGHWNRDFWELICGSRTIYHRGKNWGHGNFLKSVHSSNLLKKIEEDRLFLQVHYLTFWAFDKTDLLIRKQNIRLSVNLLGKLRCPTFKYQRKSSSSGLTLVRFSRFALNCKAIRCRSVMTKCKQRAVISYFWLDSDYNAAKIIRNDLEDRQVR